MKKIQVRQKHSEGVLANSKVDGLVRKQKSAVGKTQENIIPNFLNTRVEKLTKSISQASRMKSIDSDFVTALLTQNEAKSVNPFVRFEVECRQLEMRPRNFLSEKGGHYSLRTALFIESAYDLAKKAELMQRHFPNDVTCWALNVDKVTGEIVEHEGFSLVNHHPFHTKLLLPIRTSEGANFQFQRLTDELKMRQRLAENLFKLARPNNDFFKRNRVVIALVGIHENFL